MILNYDGFKNVDAHAASMISRLSESENYLHEMEIDEVKSFLVSDGMKSFYAKKTSVTKYLVWLFETHGIETYKLNFEIERLKASNTEFENTYFFSLDDLHNAVNQRIEETILKDRSTDFEGLRVFFLLQWYSVTMEEFISIGLSDVSANKIYIPLTKRVVIVDDKTSDVVLNYKNTTSYVDERGHNITYKQNTLLRTKRQQDVTIKTLYNVKNKFATVCKDSRFKQNRISDSAKYYELIEVENKLGRDIDTTDKDLLLQMFDRDKTYLDILMDFKKYKALREEWLLSQK